MKNPNLVYNNIIKRIASLTEEAEQELSKELASKPKQ